MSEIDEMSAQVAEMGNKELKGLATQSSYTERVSSAEEAIADDHNLGLFQAIQLYPKGILWSVAMSTALVMEGYDTKLVSTLYAQPAFQRTYGVLQSNGEYEIPAAWQAGLSNGSTTGGIIGLVISGYLGERLGFRKTVMYGMAAMMPLIFIQFFAPSLAVLQASQVLLGMQLQSCHDGVYFSLI